jgi:Hypervirulence associated proteins TUDOR domain
LAKRLSVDLARCKRKSLTFARVEDESHSTATGACCDGSAGRRSRSGEAGRARAFKVGDHVSWNSEAGRVSGLVVRVHTRDVNYKGYVHHASKDDPQYEIKSDKTNHIALHKGRALRPLRH